tara:strand:+ start:3494 stop:4864 length:1371 start_codon:yes stop_codon:yes gene_type:complete
MAKALQHHTHYTRQAQTLLAKVYGRSILKDSVLERAIKYFEHHEFVASDAPINPENEALHKLEQIERHNHLEVICDEIIELTEGDSFEESNRKSAQLLGTIQLISPTEGKKIADNNEQCKALYKAVLSLRLLDRLLINNEVSDPYIQKVLAEFEGQSFADFDAAARLRFTELVKMPLIMAALLQDIGHNHAQAKTILHGADGNQDPYRTLTVEDRKKLLQINHKQTLDYISNGIGIPSYVGNSRAKRDQFVIDEQLKHQFIKKLIKSSFKARQGVGNLLKVPQIYVSIILSTKENYNYKLLPKVFQVLNKNAELGACSQKVVDALYQITGMFPQGYGVIYMPEDEMGQQGTCYEYAIVNRLYPKKPDQPLCRVATRKLAFISYGHNIEIKKQNNLYFPHMAKKVAKLSKERLNEILELLASNYQERQEFDLLPRCWYANEFFSVKENQKLWSKGDK